MAVEEPDGLKIENTIKKYLQNIQRHRRQGNLSKIDFPTKFEVLIIDEKQEMMSTSLYQLVTMKRGSMNHLLQMMYAFLKICTENK